jgi:hypothetical protein
VFVENNNTFAFQSWKMTDDSTFDGDSFVFAHDSPDWKHDSSDYFKHPEWWI